MTTAAVRPLGPGRTIGILGGGQLGRMLALAAARLGFRTHIYCPDEDRPAAFVAAACTAAPYDDEAALRAFARSVDVVTYEFENVPGSSAQFLNHLVPVRPAPEALILAQDRLHEKAFLAGAGIGTAPFTAVGSIEDLRTAIGEIGVPAVLKTRRFGYDGKGQAFLLCETDVDAAWAAIGGVPALLEGHVDFACELSVIVSRGQDGTTTWYDPVRNIHENHVLARSVVPAGLPAEITDAAGSVAETIVGRLDYVGVMGVELFVEAGVHGSRLFVNELAPRVHNSGHWTLDACVVSQFEQHIRAICGWPLGCTARHSDAVMENLLGDRVDDWLSLSRAPDTAIHIYGKAAAVPGRKMGHVTRLYPLGTSPAVGRLGIPKQC